MNELLNSIKADLLSKRLLPALVVVGLLLLGGIAYAVHGGGSGSTPDAVVAVAPHASSSPTVSAAPADPNAATSEVTDGSRYQRQGGAHDPFLGLPLPQAAKKKAATTTTTGTTTQPATAPNSGGTPTPTTPAKPKPPAKKTVYHVAALFGLAPSTPGQSAQLTPYEDLKRLQPLPSKSNGLVVFMGVSASGKSAVFTLLAPAILHGPGQCLPSASQCQAIALKAGEVESLGYLSTDGTTTTGYQLQVVSIAKSLQATASARRFYQRESLVGRKLLLGASPAVLANLRYSWRSGVLVFRAHPHRKHR
jgi:hypothetical protein